MSKILFYCTTYVIAKPAVIMKIMKMCLGDIQRFKTLLARQMNRPFYMRDLMRDFVVLYIVKQYLYRFKLKTT